MPLLLIASRFLSLGFTPAAIVFNLSIASARAWDIVVVGYRPRVVLITLLLLSRLLKKNVIVQAFYIMSNSPLTRSS